MGGQDSLDHWQHPDYEGFDAQITVLRRNSLMSRDESDAVYGRFRRGSEAEIAAVVEEMRGIYHERWTKQSP